LTKYRACERHGGLQIPKAWLGCMLLLAWFCLVTDIPARPEPFSEYQVKAVFLLRIPSFVAWPPRAFPDPDSPIDICVLGKDPFGSVLDRVVKGATVKGRKVAIHRVDSGDTVPSCHVLFISDSLRHRLRDILAQLGEKSILTVGDFPGFAREGGMINLGRDGNRVRVVINLGAARRAHLGISSKLLKLSEIVNTVPAPEGE